MNSGHGAARLLIALEIMVLAVVAALGVYKGLFVERETVQVSQTQTDGQSAASGQGSASGVGQGSAAGTAGTEQRGANEPAQEGMGTNQEGTSTNEDGASEQERVILGTEGFSQETLETLSNMTTQQKVAQLFLTPPENITGMQRVTAAGERTRDALTEYPVGGLVYSTQNFQGTQQFEELLAGARTYSSENGASVFWVLQDERLEQKIAFSETADPIPMRETVEEFLNNPEAAGDRAGIIQPTPFFNGENATTTNLLSYGDLLVAHQLADGSAAVDAVLEGADLLYVPTEFQAVYQTVLAAAEDGEIPAERLDNAVGKILMKKAEMETPE